MKKILFAVMAVIAIGFTSCGNKAQQAEQAEPVDSVALIDSLAEEAIHETVSALNSHLEAGDADKLQQELEAVKAQVEKMVKENPELAKVCVARLQGFLKDNADKLKSVIGDKATAQTALDALISIDAQDGVAGIIGELGDEAAQAKEDAEKKAENAK